MESERFLITGAMGCIGAWAVKLLLDAKTEVWTYDLAGSSRHRLEMIADAESLARAHYIGGDITDFVAFEKAVADNGITHIVHLAALQIPFVRAEPVKGAHVNLMGMANVLEVARKHKDQIRGLAYASSFAVYGPPGGARYATASLYGVHKQAKEGMARIYWQDHGIQSVGLRPHTVYGPGRDQGMTSLPTKAMLAAAAGRPYQIGYSGNALYHHARDAAEWFIRAARSTQGGGQAFDMDGVVADMQTVVKAIESAVPDMAGKLTVTGGPLTVGYEPELGPLKAIFGEASWMMSLESGVATAISQFRTAIAAGKIDVDRSLA